MKNKKIIAISLLLLVSVVFNFYQLNNYSNLVKNSNKNNGSSSIYDYLPSLPEHLLDKKISSEKEFVLYIGRPDCGDCSFFEPTFIKMIDEYNLSEEMYYLNVSSLSKDKNEYENFKNKYSFSQVPCFLYFKNGKLVDKIDWTEKGLPKSLLTEWLIKNEII